MNTPKYKAAIFDVDGTLMETLEDIMCSVNRTVRRFGWREQTAEEIRQHVGYGFRRLIAFSIPEGELNPDYENAVRFFQGEYAVHCADTSRPFPGICELLADLRSAGVKIGASSNKGENEIAILAEKWFPGLIDGVAGNIPGRPTKPAPDGLFSLLEQFGTAKKDTVYIGDSDTDVLTAKNGGVNCISVTWGFRYRDELEKAGAYAFADNAGELKKMLLG